MMVGAPKANNTAMDRKNSLHTGKVYKCGFKQVCEKMKLEYAGESYLISNHTKR